MTIPAVISRSEAQVAGLALYFTGKPCILGGIAPRSVSEKKCQCESHNAKRAECAANRYARNREFRLEKARKRYKEKSVEIAAYKRDHYEKYRAIYFAKAYSWAKENPDRRREISSEYAKRKPEIIAANTRNRQIKIGRSKLMLKHEHIALIREIYAEAIRVSNETGIKHHVDHIVPLRGKSVSGLHVPWNLQIMPAADNRAKSNRFFMEAN